MGKKIMISSIKSNKKRRSKNKLEIVVLIGFIGFVLITGFGLSTVAEVNDMKGIKSSAPGATVNSSDGNFRINNWDTTFITQAQVEAFADVLEDTYDLLVGDWGFQDPMSASGEPPVEVMIEQITGEYNGWACCGNREKNFEMGFYPDYITQGFAADHEPLKVAGHEFFHLCQFVHPDTPPKNWVLEGMARMSQDKFSDWLDHADGTEAGSSFVRQSQGYLSNTHTSDITTRSYDICLFWQYFCEQFGSDHTDPDYGIDAISTFWDTDVNPTGEHGITMTDNALDTLSPGTTFKDVFEDFSVAIYAKDLDDTTIPSKWTFVDDNENDGSENYGTVSRRIDPVPTLSSGSPVTDNAESINSWANKYYEIDIDPGVEVITIQFNQSTNNELFYALLCMDGDDVEYYYTVESINFRRAIVNNNYDKAVVIVVGLDNNIISPSQFKYAFEAGSPDLNIEYPITSPAAYHARVGPHDAPEKFVAIVDASYRKTAPVHGFFTENFKAQINGIDATVLAAVDVYGKYFLQIQAPVQAADGLYNLKVDLVDSDTNIVSTDTEESCVDYSDTYFDTMLTVDRSGSMSTNNKILAAKSAAKLFANSFLSEDQLGIVQFQATAQVIHELMKLTSTNRATAITKIDGIATGGATSVGDGLLKSQEELFIRGIADYPDHIILLSDGKENTLPWIANALPHILGNGTSVHVITIGADAAYEEMQALAADTGGMYFHCFDPSSGDIPNDLAELYRGITEEIRHMERFYHERGTLNPGASEVFDLDVTDDMNIVEFVVHYNASLSPTMLELQDPDLTVVSFNHTNDKSGMGHAVIRIENPKLGEWQIRLAANGAGSDLLFFVEGAAHSSVNMELLSPPNGFISPAWGNTEPVGGRFPILVSINDNKPIENVEVYMTVIPPGYKTDNTIFKIPLYDDGNHGDSLPKDGIFGNIYTPTSEEGSYQYLINATGTNNDGRKFTRIQTGAFYLFKDREKTLDTDYDGLPDNWEIFNGLNPFNATGDNGKDGDPDNDWLKNSEEFYHGTNPLKSDTDNGGQGDYSEVSLGLNPLDPADDTVGKFPYVRMYPGNNHVYMLLPNSTYVDYNNLHISRSLDPVFGYSQIYSSSYVDEYNDTTVNNYQTYYYRFIADYVAFNETGSSNAYAVIPKLNTLSAEASVLINGGNKTTPTNVVTIKISLSKHDGTMKMPNTPTHMRFSEDVSELPSKPWVPFLATFPFAFSNGSGIKFIFVQLRDSQVIPENSPTFSAGIRYSGVITETIGMGMIFTIFMISVDFIVVTVVVYIKKKKHLKFKQM